MKIGYARVSTNDQNLENQISLLKENGCEDIFEEKISGAKKTRPELEKLLSQMRGFDLIAFLIRDEFFSPLIFFLQKYLRNHFL